MKDVHDVNQQLAYDREHIWHPYASMKDPCPVYPVVSASGVRIELADGRTCIDGMSSWWSAIHGYNHPVLNEAAEHQLHKMSHVMFGGLTHRPAVELAKRLLDLTPKPLNKAFFCDSGSVAVEIALKMAIQYWNAQGERNRQKILTIKSGDHGDTFGAMSVCDPVTGMHGIFSHIMPEHYFAEAPLCRFHDPWDERDIDSFNTLISTHHEQIAAVIMEPIVQGAGGMRFYSPHYLKRVRELCDSYDVLLILDEIATGFGRTGRLFACEHAEITPDIMCLGKALTGGYMSLAAVLTTDKISDGISEGKPGLFMHGPTYMANPLACSIASASIGLLMESGFRDRVKSIEDQLTRGLSPCRNLQKVKDVRVLGAIGVVEMEKPVDVGAVTPEFINHGVWLRPFDRLIYTMPPYIITPEDLSTITASMAGVIQTMED